MSEGKIEATEEVVMIEIDNKEYEVVAGLGYTIPADIALSQGFIYIDENLEDIEELELENH